MAEDYDRLSPLGEVQARKLGEFWARHGLEFRQVFRGPARRHRQTCEIAGEVMRSAGLPWPEPVVIPEFDELDAGKVMHLCLPALIDHNETVRRLNAEFRAAEATPEAGRLLQALFEEVSLHWAEERVAVEQLETWGQFRTRVRGAVESVRRETPRSSASVVFTSAGPIAATLSCIFDLPPRKSLDLIWTSRNGSYSEFLFTGERFSLSSYNSFPHLDDKALLSYR